ncbi:hypothetical protein ACIP93_32860 [Streptomyces sp. NPDC088745]|uniref:hypothetical protein n=1 Tax=Streptomyces sp. NPDC088745 TaxID=3365884 RepID=UPI0037FBC729
MSAQVTTGRERRLAAAHWLLAASPDAEREVLRWKRWPVLALPCGGLFAAVRLSADIVELCANSTDQEVIDVYLEGALVGGPVICDRAARWYYVLVPVSASRYWQDRDAPCLGKGSILGVPRPGLTRADETRVFWSVPMDSPGCLVSPGAVSQLLFHYRYLAVFHG